MVQNWIVGVIVALATLYSVWYLLPAAARQRLGRLHRALGRAPVCAPSCDSCGKCPGSAAGGGTPVDARQVQPVRFHHNKG